MEGDQLTQNLQALVDEADILTHKIQSTVPDNEFLLGLSRMVQSNIRSIIGMLDLALEDHFTESVSEYLHAARTHADTLMKMVNHIADVHSLESGEVQIAPQDSSLSEILLDVDHQMYDHMEELGGIFTMTMHQAVPTTIHTDPKRLTQCLLTLIKSTTKELNSDLAILGIGLCEQDEDQWITFEISHQRNCQCTCEKSCVCQDYWERVNTALNWDRVSQPLPDSRDLGLTVAYQLAVLLGGQLSLESSPQEPLRLSFCIPCGVTQSTEHVISEWQCNRSLCPASPTEEPMATFHGRILVADSDRMDQKMLFSTLKQFGLDVTIAETGEEVLKQAQNSQYDLVIVDMLMPDMDGCDVTRQLRDSGLHTPVIALTGSIMKPQIDACLTAGYNEHLPKPIDQTQLIEILSRYLTAAEPVEPVRA